ncbi:phosphoglycerate kinase [Methanoplanus sp. FWC-SCC4]|uniref:Phosphoglycerate kinase n=1 Tax=Methanochimaera problematica TaxID=2609417 RepID=A0AA97FCL0_9EURY|nr:phosphoglycerate kinase [Methanoplanus sp. FWC-SCC4]WOF16940.1 phosphoglycerate kinase [Methanoplanus sp. FWC-SCC4]
MKFGTLDDIETDRKTVLLRVDFNSPIDPASNLILDDKRFREHAPTVQNLSDSKVVVITHQSRPQKKDFTTLQAHAERLERLIGRPVDYTDDIFGKCAREAVRSMDCGDVLMLENVRFNAEENIKMSPQDAASTHLVRGLRAMGDIYVNDAFGTAHRSQPTIVGLPYSMKSVAGTLMEREVKTLSKVFTDAPKPVTFVLGGTKVDDSMDVAKNVLDAGIADQVLVVGVVSNVFLAADGVDIGKPSGDLIKTLGYEGEIGKAKEMLKNHRDRIVMPEHVAIKNTEGEREEVSVDKIPSERPVLDLGLESLIPFTETIKNSGTVVFNGPAGVFEEEAFSTGTFELLKAAGKADFSVVGGGHTAVVVESLGIDESFSHISTGGGACIEFLTGKKLPAVAALEESWAKFGKN